MAIINRKWQKYAINCAPPISQPLIDSKTVMRRGEAESMRNCDSIGEILDTCEDKVEFMRIFNRFLANIRYRMRYRTANFKVTKGLGGGGDAKKNGQGGGALTPSSLFFYPLYSLTTLQLRGSRVAVA